MSEYEVIALMGATQDSIVGLFQWWASISFAVMVVGHFAGDKLKWPLVAGMLILYTGFTLLIWLLLMQRGTDLAAMFQQLQSFGDLTLVGMTKLGFADSGQIGYVLTAFLSFWGTYLAAVGYLLWRFIDAKKRRLRKN